ncbi:MAG: prephenate dehydratase domain-containing protein [Ruthenibacterium sp.]
MDELAAARTEIDTVDKEMALLFCRRMDAVRQVAAYKKAHGIPVLDASREESVLAKNAALLPCAQYAEWYADFIRHNMALSRAMQKRMLCADTVAYQGVEGAFSHIALRALFPHCTEAPRATWDEVFDAVLSGDAAAGVLPFENSHAGDVAEVLDLCFAHPEIRVCAVYDLPVSQNLLCVPGATLADLKTVLSHPQALSQSARFLKSLALQTQGFANTAAAAKQVASAADKSVAAIASAETAALYGLEVLVRDVNESADNTTRFIVIEKGAAGAALSGTAGADGGDAQRFSLLFTVEHTAGSLARVMETVGALGYNMECIKSRPMPHVPWQYYFYTELVGALTEDLLCAMRGVCKTVRVLGVYAKQQEEKP